MNLSRRNLLRIHSSKYKKLKPIDASNLNLCFYCGDVMSVFDHLPSLASLDFLESVGAVRYHLLVPSCQECNQLAGDNLNCSLEERKRFINQKLEKRYKRHIQASMTDSDTSYMSERLRKSVEAFSALGREVQERISYPCYSFEVAGQKLKAYVENEKYYSMGEEFSTLTAAIKNACNGYGVTVSDYLGCVDSEGAISIDDTAKIAKNNKIENGMLKDLCLLAKENKMTIPKKTIKKYIISRGRLLKLNATEEFNGLIKYTGGTENE